jgi:hypothetical protein
MGKIERAATGVALTIALLGLAAMTAGGAQAAKRHRPHLVVHPRHLKPGEQFEVRGSGFPAEDQGEEVELSECFNHGEQLFPLECDETFALATIGKEGGFSTTMTAEACPADEETGRTRPWCYVGVTVSGVEDEFALRPYAVVVVSVR